MNKETKTQFIVALIAIFVVILSIFLPYMTATGDLAEYIDDNPNRIESYEPKLTAGDLKNISIISASKVATAAYGDAEGTVVSVVVFLFGTLLALTALFIICKKPIATIVFDILTFGIFLLLNTIMKYDFYDPDKYTWGIAFYFILIGFGVVLISSIWTLVIRNAPQQTPENIA